MRRRRVGRRRSVVAVLLALGVLLGPAVHTAGAATDPPVDFDGDGDTDVSVYRTDASSSSSWFILGRPNNAYGASEVFGARTDAPVPGDYDGDGDAEVAIFRPANGAWFVQGAPTVQFGVAGDIPVPGDYDGDGDTDRAVFRPSNGVWFVLGGPTVAFGTSGDIPVPGDYDGDGDTDIAVFRPNGIWFVLGGPTVAFGTSGDIPVPGDYDGNGDTEIAVFRPLNGSWYFDDGSGTQLGQAGDYPLPLPYAIQNVFFPLPGPCLHDNGLGQLYTFCGAPPGTPGNPATYNHSMANAAAGAWQGIRFNTTCPGDARAVAAHNGVSSAVWVYTGPLAGYVHLNPTSTTTICPTASDPTWN